MIFSPTDFQDSKRLFIFAWTQFFGDTFKETHLKVNKFCKIINSASLKENFNYKFVRFNRSEYYNFPFNVKILCKKSLFL
jgi:hypothetical protein